MNEFHIEILINSKNEIFTTLESFIPLYVYNYLNCPKSIQLRLIRMSVESREKHYTYNGLISDVKIQEKCLRLNPSYVETWSEFSTEQLNTSKLPMYEKENLFIFGVCAVSRALVLQSGNRDELLGFKKSCLLAPSEKSIWTKLCEIDMIVAIQKILRYLSQENVDEVEEILLPDCFTVFENHMGQPTKVHNFYKLLREKVQKNGGSESDGDFSTLEHYFAEGYFFSLVDVILYPLISLLHLAVHDELKFHKYFPLTHKWLQKSESYDENLRGTFLKILDIENYQTKIKEMNLNFIKNETAGTSFYRNDIKNAQDKEFTNQTQIDACLQKISELNLNIKSTSTFAEDLKFDWEKITKFARPEFGELPKQRMTRKSHQLKNLADAVIAIAKPGDVVVDFCSGTGHLGIILAESLPQCHIIFLENKSFSILKTKERVERLGLKNCSFYQSNIDYFERSFDIGVSLHACGTATDIVLTKCIQAKANFVCCPCCYGSISPMPHIHYPLSRRFQMKIHEDDFLYVAHAADQTHDVNVKNCNLEKREQGEYCMDVIDTDRKCFAEENNYEVQLKKLYPEDCTPKNRLLIGMKSPSIE